jgi:Uri superfamily endonuclease
LEDSRGTYALLLQLERQTTLTVGHLGTFPFPSGYYVYLGSAFGAGGLSARLARHQRQAKRFFWHIDYLLCHAHLVCIAVDVSGQRLECTWARAVVKIPEVQVVAPRFGASDCSCPAHLFYLGQDDRALEKVSVAISPHAHI